MQTILRIKALRREGFRRCGLHHSFETTDHPVEDFHDAQIGRLLHEPRLNVQIIEIDEDGTERLIEPMEALSDDDQLDERTEGQIIADAITGLDPQNKDHFTDGGKPQVDAVNAALKAQGQSLTVNAKDRDSVWQAMQDTQAE